jgi:hypothetical protein
MVNFGAHGLTLIFPSYLRPAQPFCIGLMISIGLSFKRRDFVAKAPSTQYLAKQRCLLMTDSKQLLTGDCEYHHPSLRRDKPTHVEGNSNECSNISGGR